MPNLTAIVVRRLRAILAQYEKVILALLAVVIAISGTIWYRQFIDSGNHPSAGGSYIAGVVGSKDKIEAIATRLTKTGLFTFDNDGRLSNQLIKNWSVNTDQTEYTLTLADGIDPQEIAKAIEDNLVLLGPATVDVINSNDIHIVLSDPNPDVPFILAAPLFDFGPYRVSKLTDQTAIFVRNTRSHSVQPYINKIVVHLFNDPTALNQALAKGAISGAEVPSPIESKKYQTVSFNLPHYATVLFNTNKAPFRDAKFRQTVTGTGAIPNQPFTLIVPDAEPYKTLADGLVKQWQSRGASVTVDKKSLEEIQNKTTPARDFQALLTGIDYGNDLDPYYVWHSSQVRSTGNNVTGFRSDSIDTLLDRIRLSQSIKEREALVNDLHARLTKEGVALFLQREAVTVVLSPDVQFVQPLTPTSTADLFQMIARWSLR